MSDPAAPSPTSGNASDSQPAVDRVSDRTDATLAPTRAAPFEAWVTTVADLTPAELHTLPDSPCMGICSTLFDEICQGCGRTAAEVYNWVFLSDAEKLTIWQRIALEGTAVRFVRGPQG